MVNGPGRGGTGTGPQTHSFLTPPARPDTARIAYNCRIVSAPVFLISRCSTLDEFIAAFRRYADRQTLFVPTATPLTAGRRVAVTLMLSTGDIVIEADADVMNSSARASGLHGRPGMTLRLTDLDDDSRAILEHLERVRFGAKATLPHDHLTVRNGVLPDGATAPDAPALTSIGDPALALAECAVVGDDAPPAAPLAPLTGSASTRSKSPTGGPLSSLPPLSSASGGKFGVPSSPMSKSPSGPNPLPPPLATVITSVNPPSAVPTAPHNARTVLGVSVADIFPSGLPPAKFDSAILMVQPTPPTADSTDTVTAQPYATVRMDYSAATSPTVAQAIATAEEEVGNAPTIPPPSDIDDSPMGAMTASPTDSTAPIEPQTLDAKPGEAAGYWAKDPTTTVQAVPPPLPSIPTTSIANAEAESASTPAPAPAHHDDLRRTVLGFAAISREPVRLPTEDIEPIDETARIDHESSSTIITDLADVQAAVGIAPQRPPALPPPRRTGMTGAPPIPSSVLAATIAPTAHLTPVPATIAPAAQVTPAPFGMIVPPPAAQVTPVPAPFGMIVPPPAAQVTPVPAPFGMIVPPPAAPPAATTEPQPDWIEQLAPIPVSDPAIAVPAADVTAPLDVAPLPPPFVDPARVHDLDAHTRANVISGEATSLVNERIRRPFNKLWLVAALIGSAAIAGGIYFATTRGAVTMKPKPAATLAAVAPSTTDAAIAPIVVDAAAIAAVAVDATPAIAPSPADAAAPSIIDASAAADNNSETTAAAKPPALDAGDCDVTFTSTPSGADILIDGTLAGVTPATVSVACAPSKVTFRKKGMPSDVKSFKPTKKGITVVGHLSRLMFTVKVTSQPSGATIAVNGKSIGKTPSAVKVPAFQTVSIGVNKDGYAPLKQPLTAKEDGTAIRFTLKKR